MEYGIPGGLFTIFFLWGLWEWSKSIKRKNSKKYDVDKGEAEVEKKPDIIARIAAYVIISIVVLVIIVIIIAYLQ